MTRRAFLAAPGVSAGALATAPFELDCPLLLDEPVHVDIGEWISKEVLRLLQQQLAFARRIEREYADHFLGVSVKIPPKGTSRQQASLEYAEPVATLLANEARHRRVAPMMVKAASFYDHVEGHVVRIDLIGSGGLD
jgi:hypothetical protein